MTRSRKLVLALGVAVLMLVSATASADRLEEDFNRTVAVSPGDKIVVGNQNGSVTVEAWDRNEVRVQATKYVEAGDRDVAEAAMRELKIELEKSANTLTIQTIRPRSGDGGFWGWMKGDNVNSGVTYKISVPRSSNLDIDTVNGRVVVSEVSGQMDLESTNGRIEVHKGSGRIDAETTNGRIYAQLKAVAHGGMRFSTTNGSVELELPDTLSANLDVSTTNGSIKTEFPITVSGTFSKNRLSGEINGGGDPLRVRTTNGSVRINKTAG